MSLADAIKALRERTGSHDKLAAKLGTSRQRIIAWEAGGYPRDFKDKLIALGVPAELFITPLPVRQGGLATQVAELRQGAAEQQAAMDALLERVEALETVGVRRAPATRGQKQGERKS